MNFCKVAYRASRKDAKAPLMFAKKTPWGYFVEAKDGSVRKELPSSTHCINCAKSTGVDIWSNKYGNALSED